MFGLPAETIKQIQSYFDSCSEIEEVRIFGSRAMGTEKVGSDIDLALLTTSAEDLSGHVKADLEDLPTPYFFDVLDYARITDLRLKDHIDQVGQPIWQKNPVPKESSGSR